MAKLRIAVNMRLLQHGKLEGIGWFAFETFKRITEAHPEHEFFFLFDRPYDKRYIFGPNVRALKKGPPARHPILYKLWFNWSVPHMLKTCQADVFVSPDGYLSLRTTVPQVAIMHDLNFEHFPKDLPKKHRDYYLKYFPKFARKAKRIVTVSEFSKNDIHARYGIEKKRIDVAYNGVSEVYQEASAAKSFCNGKPYFLCVGSLHPRKNIARLLQAFDQAQEHLEQDVQLLIVGEAFYWNKEMKQALASMKHSQHVHFSGRMAQAELRDAYAGALALAYVSYFEGFGIPLLEAMKCGCPILAANATALPEVAQEAALYCDPFSVDSISQGLVRLATEPAMAKQLIDAGRLRVQEFGWNRTAVAVWDSILKAAHG